jgi:hypothetical protein
VSNNQRKSKCQINYHSNKFNTFFVQIKSYSNMPPTFLCSNQISIKSNTLGFRSNTSNQIARQTICPP